MAKSVAIVQDIMNRMAIGEGQQAQANQKPPGPAYAAPGSACPPSSRSASYLAGASAPLKAAASGSAAASLSDAAAAASSASKAAAAAGQSAAGVAVGGADGYSQVGRKPPLPASVAA